jgi:hypothetical protein
VTLAGSEPPNRVVILQFANMGTLKALAPEGEGDLESNVGNECAGFRVDAVGGVARWAAPPAYRTEFMSSFSRRGKVNWNTAPRGSFASAHSRPP